MNYSIESVRYPDGTVVVKHIHEHGEWWRKWIVADTDGQADPHTSCSHYSGAGMPFARVPYRMAHPKKFVLYQTGGLDI